MNSVAEFIDRIDTVALLERGWDIVRWHLVREKLWQRSESRCGRDIWQGIDWKRAAIGTTGVFMYRIAKRIVRYVTGQSTIARAAATAVASITAAVSSGVRTNETDARVKNGWIIASEMLISKDLEEDEEQVEKIGEQAVSSDEKVSTEALEQVRSIAVWVGRRKEVGQCEDEHEDRKRLWRAEEAFVEAALSVHASVEGIIRDIRRRAAESVNWNNNGSSLQQIWTTLHEDSSWPEWASAGAVSRGSRGGVNWVTIGFQGLDPTDDFRGSGRYGLDCLFSFVENHTLSACEIIVGSRSPEIHLDSVRAAWYSAALAGIHVSAFILELGDTVELRHWLNTCIMIKWQMSSHVSGNWVRELMDELYGYIFIEFHKVWKNEVKLGTIKTILDFESAFRRFKNMITERIGKLHIPISHSEFRTYWEIVEKKRD
ncbi:ELMO/CED-12 family-domain-containing protein [Dipodascopsis uninucleata]